MKQRITREIVIGLSVLMVLLVILGVIVVRRFTRADHAFESSVAKLEENRIEEPHPDHPKHEFDSFPKPALLKPVDTRNRDREQSLDDPDHWNNASKEKRQEPSTNALTLKPMASDLSATERPPETSEGDRPESERKKTFRPSEAPPAVTDDRYSPAAMAPPDEHRKTDGESTMVVQVSNGESADGGPRPLDRYATGESRARPVPPGPGTAAMDANGPMPVVLPPPARQNGPSAGTAVNPEAALHHAETAGERAREAARSADGTTASAIAPASRYGNDPTYPPPVGNPPAYNPSAPVGDAVPNNSPPPGGYSQANSLRPAGDIPGRMQVPERLREDGKYEVQPNDSYWTISERVYGSGAYFRALAEQNRGRAARPDRLPPGLVIFTPPVAQLEKDYPDLCPRPNRRETVRNRADSASRGAGGQGYIGSASLASTAGGGRTYTVQEGDTLSSIARNELGKVSRWAEIYQLNREVLGKDYDYLTPGLRLVLPIRDSQPSDRMTRRSDEGNSSLR